MFISFEGGEGCGKSTQIKRLSEALTQRKIDHIVTREPGGTELAEQIRPLLVSAHDIAEDWDATAETLLFLAARVQHVRQKIVPALAAGKWVLSDRFADSTFVYQGIAKDLGMDYVQRLQHMVLGDLQPDLTLLLDIDPAIGLKRAASRQAGEDRFEALGLEFHQRLRAGFLALAESSSHIEKIDANQAVEAISQQIISLVKLPPNA